MIKNEIPKQHLIDFITQNPDSGVLDVHKAFPDIAVKALGQRLNAMAERNEITRVFVAKGGRRYSAIKREFEIIHTLHNPNYTRTVKSIFDHK